MKNFEKITAPSEGQRITFVDGNPVVPDHPIIPFIRGDGTGIDIWPAVGAVSFSKFTIIFIQRLIDLMLSLCLSGKF